MLAYRPATNQSGRTFGATLAVTTTSASALISSITGLGGNVLRLSNSGTAGLFYAIGQGVVTATVADIYLPPGAVEYITVPTPSPQNSAGLTIAAITAAGTATLGMTLGEGL